MKRFIFTQSLLVAFFLMSTAPNAYAADTSLLARVQGRILLQVESHGEAWYVHPDNGLRYYMKDGSVAYEMMRSFGLGITDADLATVASVATPDEMLRASSACSWNELANRVKGKILLQVQQHGEAWYVHPSTCRRIYLKDGATAYSVMRFLSLGITNADLAGIPTGTVPSSPSVPAPADPITPPVPAPAPTPAPVPIVSSTFYVDPSSSAQKQVNAWLTSRPDDANKLKTISSQPVGKWFGDWNDDIEEDVDAYVTRATAAEARSLLVAYNIPNRDCGSYSSGGASGSDAYRSWIRSFADGIGDRDAVVILEPDSTATSCQTDARLYLMAEAVAILKANANTDVYIDAGHDNWIDAKTMAERLTKAGVAKADGFALNVANFYTNAENIEYGTDVSARINGKHFILDTGRNGNGWNGEWCNPLGRSLGVVPSTNTGNILVDAFVWAKPPGESDGPCNGGPSPGTFWPEYALDLID